MNRQQQNGTITTKYLKQNGYHQSASSSTTQHWDNIIPVPKLSFKQAACVVFTFAILCFVNSYDGDFVFDDGEAVTGNKDLTPEVPLPTLFKHDFWGRKLESKTSHKSYRPLTVLTFRWSYSIAGGYHPMGFHIVNIILHGIVSVLMLALFSVLLAGCEVRDDRLLFGCPRASFLCGVLFAVHPVHTESVAGIVGRADLLCALFFILSFLAYVKACLKDISITLYRPSAVSWHWLCISMVLCAMSVLCKEQGITVLGIISAYDILMICRIDLLATVGIKACLNTSDEQESNKSWKKCLLYRHVIVLISGLVILITRWRLMGSMTPTFQVFDNPHSFVNGSIFRAINYNYLYCINSWLLIHPWWLCFDWSMGCIPVIESLFDWRILFVIIFWILMAALLFTSMNGVLTQQKINITMALAFLIIPFLPATNLFFRVGFVIAERVLYLPSAGFCIIVTVGVGKLCLNKDRRKAVKFCIYYVVLMLVLKCIHRSDQWRQEMSLFLSGAKVCPLNAKVHYNIGKLNGDKGNADIAIEKYRLAIELNKQYDQAMNNLGNILKERGQLVEAESLLLKAVNIREDFAAAWMNLGIVQASLHKNSSAERSYYTALKHRKKYPDCYYNLGNLYLETGKSQLAIQAFRNATLQKPDHVNAWSNMAILLDNIGLTKEAEKVGKEALQYSNDPSLMFNLANILGKQDKFKESEAAFLKAIQQSSHDSRYYANLGVLYHRWGKYEAAVKSYNKALELDPSLATTRDNLQMVYRKMEKERRK